MKKVSSKFKKALDEQFRDKGYMIVTVGIISNEAQASAKISQTSYLSDNTNPLSRNAVTNHYATFEENFTPADGSYLFPPEEGQSTMPDVGVVGEDILSSIRVDFDNAYDFKGLTINFGEAYPTDFKIVVNGSDEHIYTNDSIEWMTLDNFDEVRYFEIVPLHFVNGDNKRLRIDYIAMGVGVVFTNSELKDMTLDNTMSFTSENLPTLQLSVNALDTSGAFDVDNPDSFIGYLETGQLVSTTYGQTLEDETVEYINLPNTYLSSWTSGNMQINITAKDRLAFMDSKYSLGNTIHSRSLYDDAYDVLTDWGLEPDEFYIDESLRDIIVTNPLPDESHAVCLQLIANAGRCSLSQGVNGEILIKSNFENIIEPEDLTVEAEGEAEWSKPDNVRIGADYVYADFTEDFVPADGSMYFLGENMTEYLETGYVSDEISDNDGEFVNKPNIALILPATYTYYGVSLLFAGNHPTSVTIETYDDNQLVDTVTSEVDDNNFYLPHDFLMFDKIKFIFNSSVPHNRVVLNKIALGSITDYYLKRDNMINSPVGIKDTKIKDVMVKVFSFNPPESEGESPQKVDDEVYYTHNINTVGDTVIFENQLIGTQEHAQEVAEWLGNYYANNTNYETDYRGDPRLDAGDIIFMENKYLNNLQVDIESSTLKFSGGLSGKLKLRTAVNMLEEG